MRQERQPLPTHQAAGGILVAGSRVLLERRPAGARVYAACLDIPGGHLEDDETPDQALARELHEELGIELRTLRLATVQDHRDWTSQRLYRHYIYVVGEYDGDLEPRQQQELLWLPVTDAVRQPDINPVTSKALQLCLERRWLEP
jgi:8-oxo-dGTP diphosphatase